MQELRGRSVTLFEGNFLRREKDNRDYLMKLKTEHLLRNFMLEAGRASGRGMDSQAMGGWEDPSCQLRGHFLGHWLSAAALHYEKSGNVELKAKAEVIVNELALCQEDNGGEWACSIPEKYLYWIGKGKAVWAPQYTVHKLFMGLIDVYQYMGNDQALRVADRLADWFYRWSGEYTQEQFDNILDVETGGMLEVWGQLYQITGSEKYRTLMNRYYRRRLFEPLLEGKDVLTNMHANTTIPEVLGCARAYEVTGEEKWLTIVKMYWKCAVTDRGAYVTGGQTQGEIWTPMRKLKARLGDKNQEHCTVYNMIRLAEFLFRQTKDPAYMNYIEYNIYNGIMAQTYWRGDWKEGKPGYGLLTYFLPMKAGSKKDWAGEMDSFFCCHGTMVQANAAWNRMMFYQDGNELYVTQYANAAADFMIGENKVSLRLRQDYMNGSLQNSSENNAKQTISATTSVFANKPDFKKYEITIETEQTEEFSICLRIPDWIMSAARVYVNEELAVQTEKTDEFVTIARAWSRGDKIVLIFPIGVRFVPLPDDETMGAFRYGGEALAGITAQERILYIESDNPADELSVDTERQWGDFRTFYRTENQDPGISFCRVNDIGYEPYQIYFKIKKRNAAIGGTDPV